jgi:hypothetical protein
MGAPIGNQFAAKSKRWSMAIDRALEKRSRVAGVEALDELAEKLLLLADQSDLGALRELGDRIEGKPGQAIDLGSDPNRPVRMEIGLPWLTQQIQARNSE